MRKYALSLGVTVALIAAAPSAEARNRNRTSTTTGTVHHDPLRIETGGLVSKTYTHFLPGVAGVLSLPELEGKEVRIKVSRAQQVVAIAGRTRGNVPIMDGFGLGATELDRPRLSTPLTLVGSQMVGGQQWYEVRYQRRAAWILAEFVTIEQKSKLGAFLGNTLAPAFGLGTKVRGARFFHPDGHTYQAVVTSESPSAFANTAARMEGHALIRLGLGWGRMTDPDEVPLMDALGFALRFYDADREPGTVAHTGDQDLLLSSWSERFYQFFTRVMFETNTEDFLANDYFPAMPYEVEGQDVWLRFVPRDLGPYVTRGKNRMERLENAIEDGMAVFYLDIQRKGTEEWIRLNKVTLVKKIDIDQDALSFSPGTLQGRGLKPRGIVADMRDVIYAASRDNRDGPEPAKKDGATGALGQVGE